MEEGEDKNHRVTGVLMVKGSESSRVKDRGTLGSTRDRTSNTLSGSGT